MKKLLVSFICLTSFFVNSQTWGPATPFPGASGVFNPNSNGLSTRVNCLYEFNNDLIVGGNFSSIGGIVAHCLAKWNGNTWSTLGSGNYFQNTYVTDICEYNSKLFVAAGELNEWNGSQWSNHSFIDLSSGQNVIVTAKDLHVFNNELFITTVNGELLKYDGSTFLNMEIPNSLGSAICIEDYNNELFIGTETGVYKYSNQSWLNCTGVVTSNPIIVDLESFNGELYAIGLINSIGGLSVKNFAKYNGNSWFNIVMPSGFWPSVPSFGATADISNNSLKVENNNLFVSAWFGTMGAYDFDPSPLYKFDGTSWLSVGLNYTADGGGNTSIVYQGEIYSGGQFWYLAINVLEPIVTNSDLGCFIKIDQNLSSLNVITDNDLSIYPNPTSHSITIKGETNMNQPFQIFDQMGREVFKGKLTGTETEVNLSALSKGMYTLKIEGNYQPAQIVKE
jgi:hypothetical protein